MAQVKKLSQSEIDGVSYRRIPTWQVAIGQLHSGCAMAFYVLMGMMSYLGDVGYTAIVVSPFVNFRYCTATVYLCQ